MDDSLVVSSPAPASSSPQRLEIPLGAQNKRVAGVSSQDVASKPPRSNAQVAKDSLETAISSPGGNIPAPSTPFLQPIGLVGSSKARTKSAPASPPTRGKKRRAPDSPVERLTRS